MPALAHANAVSNHSLQLPLSDGDRVACFDAGITQAVDQAVDAAHQTRPRCGSACRRRGANWSPFSAANPEVRTAIYDQAHAFWNGADRSLWAAVLDHQLAAREEPLPVDSGVEVVVVGQQNSCGAIRTPPVFHDVAATRTGAGVLIEGSRSELTTFCTTALKPSIAEFHKSRIASRPSTRRPLPSSHTASGAHVAATGRRRDGRRRRRTGG